MGKKSVLPLVSWPQKTRTDAAFRSLSSRLQNRDWNYGEKKIIRGQNRAAAIPTRCRATLATSETDLSNETFKFLTSNQDTCSGSQTSQNCLRLLRERIIIGSEALCCNNVGHDVEVKEVLSRNNSNDPRCSITASAGSLEGRTAPENTIYVEQCRPWWSCYL